MDWGKEGVGLGEGGIAFGMFAFLVEKFFTATLGDGSILLRRLFVGSLSSFEIELLKDDFVPDTEIVLLTVSLKLYPFIKSSSVTRNGSGPALSKIKVSVRVLLI